VNNTTTKPLNQNKMYIDKEAGIQIIVFIAGMCIGGAIVAWVWIMDNESN